MEEIFPRFWGAFERPLFLLNFFNIIRFYSPFLGRVFGVPCPQAPTNDPNLINCRIPGRLIAPQSRTVQWPYALKYHQFEETEAKSRARADRKNSSFFPRKRAIKNRRWFFPLLSTRKREKNLSSVIYRKFNHVPIVKIYKPRWLWGGGP